MMTYEPLISRCLVKSFLFMSSQKVSTQEDELMAKPSSLMSKNGYVSGYHHLLLFEILLYILRFLKIKEVLERKTHTWK